MLVIFLSGHREKCFNAKSFLRLQIARTLIKQAKKCFNANFYNPLDHERSRNQSRTDRPALKAAGWGEIPESRIRREVIAPGRLVGSGKRSRPKSCDYVLVYRNQKLAALEAKKVSLHPTEGLGQAKDYAERLKTPLPSAPTAKKSTKSI